MNYPVRKPKVAILIPVFNGDKYLRDTLRSVLDQKYPSMVVMVCDDGSTDGSQKIIESELKRFEGECTVIQHPLNLGLSRSLIDLCEAAKPIADVAVILGQDDLIPNDYLQKISRYFHRERNAIVSTRALCVDSSGERITEWHTPPFLDFLGRHKTSFLLAANQINAPGVAFSLKSFDPNFVGEKNPLTQDWRQWIYMSVRSSIKVCVSTNVFYRKHSESLTSRGSVFASHLEISQARIDFLSSHEFADSIRSWNMRQRRAFLAVTRTLFSEFNCCSHNLEFLEKLAFTLLGECDVERKVKYVESCDGRNEFSKLDIRRKRQDWEKTHKSLVVDSPVTNFLFVLLSTFRLLAGRICRVAWRSISRFRNTVNQITIYSTGGLGAQLSALAYAIWIRNRFNRTVKIRFNEKGLTFYPITIEDLLVDIPYEIVAWRESEVQISSPSSGDIPVSKARLKSVALSAMKSLLKRGLSPFRLVISEEHLSKVALNKIKKTTKYVKGYHTDWGVIDESWDALSEVISDFRKNNFMVAGGSEHTVSVHWRLGDFLNNPQANFTHGTVSPEALLTCLRSIQLKVPVSNVQVFTDSPEIAESLLRELDSEFRFTFISGDIWEDLFQMSRSRVFVGSHSSISTWAAFSIARANPESVVYLPNKWFKNEPMGFDTGSDTFRKPQEIVTSIRGYDAQIR